MATTKIEWADKVWNPITGCTQISEGCQNCYAKRMANRLQGRFGYPKDEPFRVTFHADRLEEISHWRKPRRIFVCSMGDLFHPEVHDQWLLDIWHIMEHSQQHTFLILTKRPLSARSFLLSRDPMKHIWIGVTAENQARADERIPILLSIPAAVHFVSCEPLLEPVDIGLYLPGISRHYSDVLNWVIAGPETGQKPRECKPEWITDLWRQCQAAGVPFFDKREQFIERRWPKN